MPQFMVRRFDGGDKPETEYLPVEAEDALAAAMKACGGEQLVRGGNPGNLRALVNSVPAKPSPTPFRRSLGPVIHDWIK